MPRNVFGFEQKMQEGEYGILCGELDTRFFGRVIPNVQMIVTLALNHPPGLLGEDSGKDRRNTVLNLTGGESRHFFHALPPGRYTPTSIKAIAIYQFEQVNYTLAYPDIPLSLTAPLDVRSGELTYIGKLTLALPVYDVTIESFVATMKEQLLASPEREALVRKAGRDFDGQLPAYLNSSSRDAFFYLLLVEDELNGLKALTDTIWGYSKVYQGMRITSSLIGTPGFQYEDRRSDRDKAQAFNDKGAADFAGGRYDKALSAYERSIELDADNPFPYNNRGLVSLMRGQIDAAIADFDRAIQRAGTFGHAYHNRAKARAEKGLHQAALEDYEEALKLKGKDGHVLADRGNLFAVLGDIGKACADFQAACDRKVCKNYEDYQSRGICR